MTDLSKLCRDILLTPYPQRMPGASMQSIPDPSWKLYGPPDDGFSDYIEQFREDVLDNWTVGELMDKLPTKLSSDLWMWIEERGIREFLEMRAARRNRED